LLAIWAAAVATILPMHVFGQREHIATLTFLPALAVYALRSNRDPVPAWAVIIAGVGVGITLAFKPFFTFPAVLCILAGVIRSHDWRLVFAPENFIAGAIVLVVSTGTYLLYPEYFTLTYPLVRDTYLSWSMSPSVIFLNTATLILTVALAFVAVTMHRGRLDGLLLVAIVASVGFAISFYLQRRGWSYHSYPMVALAMLAVGYTVMSKAAAGAPLRLSRPATTIILTASFVLGLQWFNTQVHIGPVLEAVARLKPHPRLLVLSGEAAIGHPLVRDIGGVWVSRQENLWIREFVRLTRERTSVDAPTDARLNAYLALERSWLIEDFKKLPPDLVLVDNLRDGWGDWVRADAELTLLLRPYRLVGSVEGIDILERAE
ncbi:hypothetical protein, partial [Bradyrhizobium sp. STM 3843]|uniref:hypothetical protein n=1 Tax=Bradyrhizobium sp. STM 3843 TaxID=551947 RepID=UPI0005620EB8